MDPITRMVAAGAAGAAGGGDPTYVDDMFSTHVYEGTSSTQSIDNGIDLSGEGGLVWFKNRITNTGVVNLGHVLQDTERGNTKFLRTQGNAQEETSSSMISSFNSNGFTFGSDTNINFNSDKGVAWTFRKAPGFFDVVTYSGQSNNGVFDTWFTVPHNLGSTPGCVIIKSTSNSESWVVWHRSMPTETMHLNQTGGANDSNYTTWFGHANGAADANNIYIRAGQFAAGYPGYNYVAYVFAHDDQSFGTNSDEAIIKCGNYTGTGSNGNFVDVGFEPQWLLIKNATTGSTNWLITDVMRGMPASGGTTIVLAPNSPAAETTQVNIAPNPTGFTLAGAGSYSNQSGDNFIYMAIRRPHKPPTDATEVFNVKYLANGSTNLGFVADTNISKYPAGTQEWYWNSRLTGNKDLNSNNSGAEDTAQPTYWDLPTNTVNYGSYTGYHVNYVFRRAPGFFDVVAFTGTGSSRTVDHNLGVIPELMIVKRRNASSGWNIYHETNGNTKKHYFSTGASFTSTDTWNSTSPTAQNFTVGTNIEVNGSGDTYIAYLFASLAGISKVGSYTGTGSNVDVDCGFTAGARFVLIKRTDSTGNDWYVYDTARGIVSGNDPYHFINSTAVQVTNTDYIDPLNAGFTVTSSAPAALNASGGTYIFLAIA